MSFEEKKKDNLNEDIKLDNEVEISDEELSKYTIVPMLETDYSTIFINPKE